MEIDDYLSQLQQDLESSLNQVGRSLDNTLNGEWSESAEMSFCPECGSRIDADSNFCPFCGTCLTEGVDPVEGTAVSEMGVEDNSDEDAETSREGILFTDTYILAKKYGIDRQDVIDIFTDIVENTESLGNKWHFLDGGDYSYLRSDRFWLDYNDVISDFMESHSIPYGIRTPVFLIGGDDVIPIPMVEDTYGTSDNGLMPCDMCYCFNDNFFNDIWDGGDRSISESSVRNNVARLPLEDGDMETKISDDITAYFARCNEYAAASIPIEHVMMTANASWLPASHTMSEHLPLVNDAEGTELEEDMMYVCPPVSPEDESTIKPLNRSMAEAGMLLFNLHGSDSKEMSGFYCDEGEAFTTSMLREAGAKVLNTVACFGSRYHGYSRDDSMLLSAIYKNSFLLYAGSLVSVPMIDPDVPEGVDVHPGSGSEHLMPIFCMEQYSGLPAGEAMTRAKLEYFNTFRQLERDDFSLATIMMFSLYGNPMLCIQRDEDVLKKSKELHVIPELPMLKSTVSQPIRVKRLQRAISRGTKDGSSSILSDIRGCVDDNLLAIHQAVQRDIYAQFNLEPRTLDHVDSFTMPDGKGFALTGYIYAYKDESKAYGNRTWIEVDSKGRVLRKTTVK